MSLVVYSFRHPNSELNWSRIALLANTMIVFGYLIAWFNDSWKNILFWVWLLVLLVGHVAFYVFVLGRVGQFPLMYYVILNAGELVLFFPFLSRRVSNRSSRGSKKMS